MRKKAMTGVSDRRPAVGVGLQAPLSSHLPALSSPSSFAQRPPRQLSSSSPAASASAESTVPPTSTQASPASPRPRLSTMSELLSLSVLQLLSVFSFLTSVLAVVCVGSGSLHRLAHRVEPGVDAAPDMSITSGKHPLWNWSGLPVSFSLDSLIGEDEQEEPSGYVGGTELTRMDWQVSRSQFVTPTYDSRAPMSMAKLIMSRHVSTLSGLVTLPHRLRGRIPAYKLMEAACLRCS
ncbi:hypothetical protein OH76DRAFT_1554144 [Lentinus brumalis]|uniref:Transmembrane protein n=1 Tax=Lentinus brumalis TaxID=2498619 RepID=A0A371DIS6_9APHY|nr:hypothetical protein OH76DRAFT_1554144 [Polyporus brumalis]